MLGLLLLAAEGTWLPALTPFGPYVGHCWTTTLPSGATDRHCFTAVYGGKHVRDTHVVSKDHVAVYSGETIYSVEASGVTFVYLNSLGGVGRGAMRVAQGDLHFALTMRGTPNSPPQAAETVWHWTGDGYDTGAGAEKRHFRRAD